MDEHDEVPLPDSGSARERVADFWDEVLADWLAGREHPSANLARWRESYQGKGKGAVDLEHYPDPYVGDLRGVEHEPRMVLLGLNPGIGYDSLQSRSGLWARRIARSGYSYCFDRSPEEDPKGWRELHRTRSRYWQRCTLFAQRWLNDQHASVRDILNFELYPWHSYAVTAPMQPPADLIDRFVWAPVQELAVAEVFAFGRDWFKICETLGLRQMAMFGPDGDLIPSDVENWRLGFYQLPSRQVVVVSSQPGYAGPPKPDRLKMMRALLDEVRGRGTVDASRRSAALRTRGQELLAIPSEIVTGLDYYQVTTPLRDLIERVAKVRSITADSPGVGYVGVRPSAGGTISGHVHSDYVDVSLSPEKARSVETKHGWQLLKVNGATGIIRIKADVLTDRHMMEFVTTLLISAVDKSETGSAFKGGQSKKPGQTPGVALAQCPSCHMQLPVTAVCDFCE